MSSGLKPSENWQGCYITYDSWNILELRIEENGCSYLQNHPEFRSIVKQGCNFSPPGIDRVKTFLACMPWHKWLKSLRKFNHKDYVLYLCHISSWGNYIEILLFPFTFNMLFPVHQVPKLQIFMYIPLVHLCGSP